MRRTGTARKAGPRRPAARRGRIVHEDDALVVVDKPTGLLTISTERERHRTLYRQLFDREAKQRKGGRIFVVHRLDRDASGLLVFAKSEENKLRLQAQFHDRTATRRYRAVVRGRYPRDTDVLRSLLAQNRAFNVYVTHDPRAGKLAVTRVRVLRRGSAATLLEVSLDTGRKHQIRVHLAAEGHPLLGDRRYGEDRPGPLGRLALHAATLEFDHPVSGERMQFASPLPRKFLHALRGDEDEPPRPAAQRRRPRKKE